VVRTEKPLLGAVFDVPADSDGTRASRGEAAGRIGQAQGSTEHPQPETAVGATDPTMEQGLEVSAPCDAAGDRHGERRVIVRPRHGEERRGGKVRGEGGDQRWSNP